MQIKISILFTYLSEPIARFTLRTSLFNFSYQVTYNFGHTVFSWQDPINQTKTVKKADGSIRLQASHEIRDDKMEWQQYSFHLLRNWSRYLF